MRVLDVKPGDRVVHYNHGAGVVTARGSTDWEAFVRFDVRPEGWDQELCVSTPLLKMEKVTPFKYKDGKPIIPQYVQKIVSQVSWIGLYTYKLTGINKNRRGYGILEDMARFKSWAERHGAEVIIKTSSNRPKNYYVIFEMTDPVAQALEKAGLLK